MEISPVYFFTTFIVGFIILLLLTVKPIILRKKTKNPNECRNCFNI